MEPKTKEGNIWGYEDERTRILINRKWCKGCEICVEFCPKKTLAMEGTKAIVADISTCSQCMLCELRCPDFAIEVFDLRPPKGKPERPAEPRPKVPAEPSINDSPICEATEVTKETED